MANRPGVRRRAVPLPDDLSHVTAICQETRNGDRWYFSIRPGTIALDEVMSVVTFCILWSGPGDDGASIKRFTIALERITGYEETR